MVARSQSNEAYSSAVASPNLTGARNFASTFAFAPSKSLQSFQNIVPNGFGPILPSIKSSFSAASSFASVQANAPLQFQTWATSHLSSDNSNAHLINSKSSENSPTGDLTRKAVIGSVTTVNPLLTTVSQIPASVIPNITVSSIPPPPTNFPLYAIIICAIVAFVMTSTVLYFLCRCLTKRRKRRNQLAALTTKVSDPRMAGIRADQPIEFVVPTTIIISENTDDSLSDTDYSSGGPRQLPMMVDRRKKRPFSGYHINPEELKRGLYEGVAAKMESGAFLGSLGKIGFSLHYNTQRNQLCVRVIGATDLPCLFLKTTANPCVKVVMMPDRTPKYVTKVQRNTMNPMFNEIFVFPVMINDLETKKLKISVWDYDKFSRKLLIGQILYSIRDSGLINSLNDSATTGDIWVDLKQDMDSHYKGSVELLFSLCYNPETSSLTLCILKIRGLDMGDKEKETAVYAKVTLYVRRKMTRTKKTSSKRKTPNMEFNNSFHIHVPPASIRDVDLLVTLCEKSSALGSKKLIGRTQVGSNCLSDQGLQHWQDMLLSPKSTCAQWHVLSTF